MSSSIINPVLFLHSSRPPEAFLNKLPSQLEFYTSNQTVKLTWPPQRAHMRHYLVSDRIQDSSQFKSLEFLPFPAFEIKISKTSEGKSSDDFDILGESFVY